MQVPAGRRVVVTGIGAISPLGNTMEKTWDNLCNRTSGITTLETALSHQGLNSEQLEQELQLASTLPCQVAASVQGVSSDPRTSRMVQLALIAGREAMQQSKLETWLDNVESSIHVKQRIGVSIGTGMSSIRDTIESMDIYRSKGLRKITPHLVPKLLSNSAAGRLSIEYGFCGPTFTHSTACAASAHSIGEAFRCIQRGDADCMLAGGSESCIDPLSIAGFCRLRALSTGLDPSESSRPFDVNRNGFVMAEGACVLVMEEMEQAVQRNAPILAEIVGYAATSDAFHITAPDETGKGAFRAMQQALFEASASHKIQVGYVNAHATSTPLGDKVESQVIHNCLSSSMSVMDTKPRVGSTKGSTGHLLGAAGAIESGFTVLALASQTIPPSINIDNVDCVYDSFDYALEKVTAPNMTTAVCNSFGFGGTNASIIFSRYAIQ